MRTNEILSIINSEGGFNRQNWSHKEKAEWVYANYPCSKYVANNVAFYL